MTDKEKEIIFQKTIEKSERDKIRNTGISVYFGNEEVNLKALSWDDSNNYEDAIVKASEKLGCITKSDLTQIKIDEVIKAIVGMLREDLVDVAGIATRGKINIDYIRQVEATKDDVIKVVIESFKVNYSYLKNLRALMGA